MIKILQKESNNIMVESSQPIVDENGVPEVRAQDILKEGFLLKQSRYIKDWRK
jgi:hypothetical protein